MRRTRALHRKSRASACPILSVALVGYTNAGKSTLFNALTGAAVLAEDTLFATLDPTHRAIRLPHGSKAVLSDTVGFISDLPTTLIAAFRATLEEVLEADLILHVRDIADEATTHQRADVNAVLAELGVDAAGEPGRLLEVWNKADLLDAGTSARLLNEAARDPENPCLVSAVTGEGLEELLAEIERRLGRARSTVTDLDPEEGALSNWIHENCEVIERADLGDGAVSLRIRVPLRSATGSPASPAPRGSTWPRSSYFFALRRPWPRPRAGPSLPASILRRAAFGAQRRLDMCEPPHEFRVGVAQAPPRDRRRDGARHSP